MLFFVCVFVTVTIYVIIYVFYCSCILAACKNYYMMIRNTWCLRERHILLNVFRYFGGMRNEIF